MDKTLNDIKGDTLELEGSRVPKTAMIKRKNDEDSHQVRPQPTALS